MSITCKNCEHEFESGKFCPECGAEVKEPPKEKAPTSKEMFNQMYQTNRRLNKRLDELEEKERKRKERESNGDTGEIPGLDIDFL